MRTIPIIIILSLISLGVNSQQVKKFNYQKNRFGAIVVTPNFDQNKPKGERGVATSSDPYYLRDIFDKITKDVMTKEKVDLLYSDATFNIILDSKGKIVSCMFTVNSKDLDVISDEDFFNLYKSFTQTNFDMSKVNIISPDSPVKKDYAYISGTLIPTQYK